MVIFIEVGEGRVHVVLSTIELRFAWRSVVQGIVPAIMLLPYNLSLLKQETVPYIASLSTQVYKVGAIDILLGVTL